MIKSKLCLLPLVLAAALDGFCQPTPETPRVYVDSSYHHPSGATIYAKGGADLQAALDAAKPGETIVVEAGATFTGNFALPPKTGNGWIYVQSSAIDKLPPAGQRISPSDAADMPKIQTPNSMAAISALPGAANYRITGLEITPATGAPRVYQLVYIDFNATRIEAQLHSLAQRLAPGLVQPDVFPQNIIIDRCYIHGSDKQDVREGVAANGISVAVVDSHISDIHDSTMDSQAIIAYRTPGPIKIVNNFLSATTEDVMLGGAGGANNPYVPSDIEIRRNHFFKPLSWQAPGVTLPPHNRWAVKNNLEFKDAQRVIATGNVLENNWVSAQVGVSVLLTVRTAGGGNNAVVNDITIDSNTLTNVDSGFNTLEHDDQCKAPNFPDCTNPGEEKRIKISNNLILLNPEDNGSHHGGLFVAVDMTDLVFQHNTILMNDQSTCWNSIFFNMKEGWRWPPPRSVTHNVWILDNVLCRQPTGDWGAQGTEGLAGYMGDPPPLAPRFLGNVMHVPPGDTIHSFPPKNTLQTKLAYANAAAGNYQLMSPKWTQTSDGTPAGVDMASLKAAMNPDAPSMALLRPQVAILQPGQTEQFFSPFDAPTWQLTPPVGTIAPSGLYTAPTKIANFATNTVCAVTNDSLSACASIIVLPQSQR